MTVLHKNKVNHVVSWLWTHDCDVYNMDNVTESKHLKPILRHPDMKVELLALTLRRF
jgi:hypothetical protein